MPLSVKPAGVGELRVIRKQVARYEAGEIAYIENVLKGEDRLRRHEWRQLSEQTFERETEETKETLQDLQSVQRHELEREMTATARSEFQAKAGFSLSANYGQVVLGLTAEVGTTETREQSQRSAERFSKELTQRSVERITTKVRELQRAKMLQESSEVNRHSFVNTAAESSNISGVYRWVDAVYRAKVQIYGQRLFYDFLVPEPSAYLHSAMAQKLDSQGEVLEKPLPPEVSAGVALRPDHVTRENYTQLLSAQGATDVPPPPPEYRVIAHMIVEDAVEAGSTTPSLLFTDEIEIPSGYRGVFAYVPFRPVSVDWPVAHIVSIGAHTATWDPEDDGFMPDRAEEILRQEPHRSHRPKSSAIYRLAGESGKLAVAGKRDGITSSIALTVEVLCRLDASLFSKWQLEVYAAIMRAFRAQEQAFDERLASARLGGAVIGTANPAVNRSIALREIKRSCLALWTGRETGAESSLRSREPDAEGNLLPPILDPDGAAREGRRAAFLESAFEWENAQVELYPYYWGRQSEWQNLLQVESADLEFQTFLQAGGARVYAPVAPERVPSVLFFQVTEIIRDDVELPVFVPRPGEELTPEESLYNAYIDDLADEAHVDDLSRDPLIAADDPDSWLIRIPTAAVTLDAQGLPDLERERAGPEPG